VRFLADVPISPQTVAFLRAQGHDVASAVERPMHTQPDLEDNSPAAINRLLAQHLPLIEQESRQGALLLIEPTRIRVRHLPIP